MLATSGGKVPHKAFQCYKTASMCRGLKKKKKKKEGHFLSTAKDLLAQTRFWNNRSVRAAV